MDSLFEQIAQRSRFHLANAVDQVGFNRLGRRQHMQDGVAARRAQAQGLRVLRIRLQ